MEEENKSFKDFNRKIREIQRDLDVPKKNKNSYGGYFYRTCEEILEKVKPLLVQYDLCLSLEDTIEMIGNRYYVKATAELFNENEKISVTAYAREAENKKGMDEAQITGSASSYARKYALNGLFLIDDVKDMDDEEITKHIENQSQNPASEKQLDEIRRLIDKFPEDKQVAAHGIIQEKFNKKLPQLTKKEASQMIDELNSMLFQQQDAVDVALDLKF